MKKYRVYEYRVQLKAHCGKDWTSENAVSKEFFSGDLSGNLIEEFDTYEDAQKCAEENMTGLYEVDGFYFKLLEGTATSVQETILDDDGDLDDIADESWFIPVLTIED